MRRLENDMNEPDRRPSRLVGCPMVSMIAILATLLAEMLLYALASITHGR